MLGNMIPQIRFVSAGPGHGFQLKRTRELEAPAQEARELTRGLVIDKVGMDIYSGVGVLPTTAAYYVSDPDALKVSHISTR